MSKTIFNSLPDIHQNSSFLSNRQETYLVNVKPNVFDLIEPNVAANDSTLVFVKKVVSGFTGHPNCFIHTKQPIDPTFVITKNFFFHRGDTIKKRGLVVKPPIVLPVPFRPAFRSDPKFNTSWIRQRPATPAATPFMFD